MAPAWREGRGGGSFHSFFSFHSEEVRRPFSRPLLLPWLADGWSQCGSGGSSSTCTTTKKRTDPPTKQELTLFLPSSSLLLGRSLSDGRPCCTERPFSLLPFSPLFPFLRPRRVDYSLVQPSSSARSARHMGPLLRLLVHTGSRKNDVADTRRDGRSVLVKEETRSSSTRSAKNGSMLAPRFLSRLIEKKSE